MVTYAETGYETRTKTGRPISRKWESCERRRGRVIKALSSKNGSVREHRERFKQDGWFAANGGWIFSV